MTVLLAEMKYYWFSELFHKYVIILMAFEGKLR